MPGTDCPIDAPRMAEANGSYNLTGTKPDNDACSLEGVATSIPGTLNPATMTPTAVSLATQQDDAPPLGSFLRTNLHDDYWCDPLKPHISPESQKG